MPIAVFSAGGPPTLGKIFGDRIVDLSKADRNFPTSIIAFLEGGKDARARFDAVGQDGPSHSLRDVRLHAPIPNPQKLLAIGLNYKDHAEEAKRFGMSVPEYQMWFNKQVSCITGPYDQIIKPRASDLLDYEAELAVVIGKPCKYVDAKNARDFIGGYMIINDVSVRDWQRRSPTFTLGKSFDTHGPTGPWLTLPEEVEDPCNLGMRLFVNGDIRQDGNSSSMINSIYDQIAYLSTVTTLKTGDILATGTPAGVGVARQPPIFLKSGDVVRIEIDRLGHIENKIVDET